MIDTTIEVIPKNNSFGFTTQYPSKLVLINPYPQLILLTKTLLTSFTVVSDWSNTLIFFLQAS